MFGFRVCFVRIDSFIYCLHVVFSERNCRENWNVNMYIMYDKIDGKCCCQAYMTVQAYGEQCSMEFHSLSVFLVVPGQVARSLRVTAFCCCSHATVKNLVTLLLFRGGGCGLTCVIPFSDVDTFLSTHITDADMMWLHVYTFEYMGFVCGCCKALIACV